MLLYIEYIPQKNFRSQYKGNLNDQSRIPWARKIIINCTDSNMVYETYTFIINYYSKKVIDPPRKTS